MINLKNFMNLMITKNTVTIILIIINIIILMTKKRKFIF